MAFANGPHEVQGSGSPSEAIPPRPAVPNAFRIQGQHFLGNLAARLQAHRCMQRQRQNLSALPVVLFEEAHLLVRLTARQGLRPRLEWPVSFLAYCSLKRRCLKQDEARITSDLLGILTLKSLYKSWSRDPLVSISNAQPAPWHSKLTAYLPTRKPCRCFTWPKGAAVAT